MGRYMYGGKCQETTRNGGRKTTIFLPPFSTSLNPWQEKGQQVHTIACNNPFGEPKATSSSMRPPMFSLQPIFPGAPKPLCSPRSPLSLPSCLIPPGAPKSPASPGGPKLDAADRPVPPPPTPCGGRKGPSSPLGATWSLSWSFLLSLLGSGRAALPAGARVPRSLPYALGSGLPVWGSNPAVEAPRLQLWRPLPHPAGPFLGAPTSALAAWTAAPESVLPACLPEKEGSAGAPGRLRLSTEGAGRA